MISLCYCHNTTFSNDKYKDNNLDSEYCNSDCKGDPEELCGINTRIRFVEMNCK